ncbi:hypothetical protein BVRB_005430 [Beta vulgaris subsp. vulgaris]|uniref:Uncharacterized protein n=1 Tax=Beta vulgaris subsp. vulgaris TaxID=3555 RepID=A0A0J8B421_BETVV|nr:hypothetical protein BVRB_005430 [Beta vulgaris subsp. vulgaris]
MLCERMRGEARKAVSGVALPQFFGQVLIRRLLVRRKRREGEGGGERMRDELKVGVGLGGGREMLRERMRGQAGKGGSGGSAPVSVQLMQKRRSEGRRRSGSHI